MKFNYDIVLGLQLTLGTEPTFTDLVKSDPKPESFTKKYKKVIPRTQTKL